MVHKKSSHCSVNRNVFFFLSNINSKLSKRGGLCGFHTCRISTEVPPFVVLYLHSGMKSDSNTEILDSNPLASSCLNTQSRRLSRVNHFPSLRQTVILGILSTVHGSFIHCSKVLYIVR